MIHDTCCLAFTCRWLTNTKTQHLQVWGRNLKKTKKKKKFQEVSSKPTSQICCESVETGLNNIFTFFLLRFLGFLYLPANSTHRLTWVSSRFSPQVLWRRTHSRASFLSLPGQSSVVQFRAWLSFGSFFLGKIICSYKTTKSFNFTYDIHFFCAPKGKKKLEKIANICKNRAKSRIEFLWRGECM